MRQICPQEECTGCGACNNICPCNAISMGYNKNQELVPIIDESKCVNCKMCEKVCPNNSIINFNKVISTYAVWNKDLKEQETSTSGGVAAYFYEKVIKDGGVAVGCDFNEEMDLVHSISQNIEDCKKYKQSKYAQSNVKLIYRQVKEILCNNKKVLFVGTPCQVQGLKNYLGKEYENLLLVDIICHGVPSNKFLKNHIQMIKKKEKIDKVTFRENGKYVLKLYSNNNIIYRESVQKDEYLIGFLNNILERESCFQCKYAKSERVSDLTIGDFWGIGKNIPFEKPEDVKVSLVLANTEKGKKFLEESKEGLHIEERQLDEAVSGNRMLRQHAEKHKNYDDFRRLYLKYGYKKSIKKCLSKELYKGRIIEFKKKIKWV